jgi:hypothetical protein
MITKEQAVSLAVEYSAYRQACNEDDVEGILMWGRMLEETMQETGVVFGKHTLILFHHYRDMRDNAPKAFAEMTKTA